MRPLAWGGLLFLAGAVGLALVFSDLFGLYASGRVQEANFAAASRVPYMVLFGLLTAALPIAALWELGGWMRRGRKRAWLGALLALQFVALLLALSANYAPGATFALLLFGTPQVLGVLLASPWAVPRPVLSQRPAQLALGALVIGGFLGFTDSFLTIIGAVLMLAAPFVPMLTAPEPATAAPEAPAAGLPAPARPASARYRMLRELPAGAFGNAVVAEDPKLGRKVVLKRLRREWEQDAAVRAAFLREARIAGQLNHPHVVTVHDIDDGEPATIVMEFVEGGSLADRLERGRLTRAEAVRLADEVLQGLERVHAEGIFHRDLKPANILLTREGRAKIADFGIAHAPQGSAHTARLSMTGYQPGTLLYMAPEQVRGEKPDARTDLYAVGAMLHEMLTGQHYLGAAMGDFFEMQKAVVERAYKPPPELGSLGRFLQKALAKERDKRHGSAGDMRAALARAAAKSSAPARPRSEAKKKAGPAGAEEPPEEA